MKKVYIIGGAIVIFGLVSYFALSWTPSLAHRVSSIEELLPADCKGYVVVNVKELKRFLNKTSFYKKMKKMHIDKEIQEIPLFKKLNQKTKGRFFSLLGSEFVVGFYKKGYIVVSKPSWWMRIFWRGIRNERTRWYSGFFIHASSKELMERFIKVNSTKDGEYEKPEEKDKGWIIRGKIKKGNTILNYENLYFTITNEGKGTVIIDKPGGILGIILLGEFWFENPYVPKNPILYISLKNVDMEEVWRELKKKRKSNIMESFFSFLGNKVFLVFTGFNEKKMYHAYKLILGFSVKRKFSKEDYEDFGTWFFKGKGREKEINGVSVIHFEEKGYKPSVYMYIKDGYLFLTTDSSFIGTKGAEVNKGFYFDIQSFKKEFIKYLLYLGAKSPYFTEKDVKEKIIPVIEAVSTRGIRMEKKKEPNVLKLSFILEF